VPFDLIGGLLRVLLLASFALVVADSETLGRSPARACGERSCVASQFARAAASAGSARCASR
jgi:hypothetical protein